MRVIGQINSTTFRNMNDYDRRPRHSRLRPDTAEHPASQVIHRLDRWRTYRGQRGLVFHYARTRRSGCAPLTATATSTGYRRTRASYVILPDDRFILPFDLAGAEQMRTYLPPAGNATPTSR